MTQRIRATSIRTQIRRALITYIKQMDPKGEGKLPSEIDMSHALGVSRISLREVIKQLEQDGMLVSIHGKGTYVNRDMMKMKVRLTPAVEFEQAIRNSGYEAGVSLEDVTIGKPSDKVRKALNLGVEDTVVTVRKIFYADEKPVVFCEDIFPRSLLGDKSIIREELEISTFEYLLEKSGITVVHDIAELQARSSSDLEGFTHLDTSSPKPLLLIESVYYSIKHKPVMYVNAYMDTKYIKLSILRRQDVYTDQE